MSNASELEIYAGGSLGAAFFDTARDIDLGDRIERFEIDDDDFGWKIYLGLRATRWIAFETGYVSFGQVGATAVSQQINAAADGWSTSLVFTLPIGPLELFAKGGLINWEVEEMIIDGLLGIEDEFDDEGSDYTAGFGASMNLGRFAVRAEVEMFNLPGIENLYMLSVGATLRF
jgi:hypothetical protein